MGIPDPDAKKPEDWDDEDDGKWEHPMIDNPDYSYNEEMYKVCKDGCTHVGFEIWQVKTGTLFDDIIVTDSIEEAEEYAKDTFFKKKDAEKKMYDEQQEKKKEEEEDSMGDMDGMDDDYMAGEMDDMDMDGMMGDEF